MINKRLSMLMLLSMFSGMIISRPDTITVTLGSNVPPNFRVNLQWLGRADDERLYRFGTPVVINLNSRSKITVPPQFRLLDNSRWVPTDGFMLTPLKPGTLNSGDQKGAHIVFPRRNYDGSKNIPNITYEFQLIPNIVESRENDSRIVESNWE